MIIILWFFLCEKNLISKISKYLNIFELMRHMEIQGFLLICGLDIHGFGKFTVFKDPKSPQIHIFHCKKTKLNARFLQQKLFSSIFFDHISIKKHFKKNFIPINLPYSHSSKFVVLKFAVFQFPQHTVNYQDSL